MSERSSRAPGTTKLLSAGFAAACLLIGGGASAHPWDHDDRWDRHGPPPYRRWDPPSRRWDPPPRYYPGWDEGRWWRGPHEGRFGWWWVVGDGWYSYSAPVYPYPYPYPAPVYVEPAPATAGGAVAGAVTGGIIGGELGRGPGAIVGSLLGAFVGMEIGRSIDQTDRLAAEDAARRAYYQVPIGQAVTWDNPGNGHGGAIVTLRDGTDSSGNYCREYQQTVKIGGRTSQAYGTACRQPDGSWMVVR